LTTDHQSDLQMDGLACSTRQYAAFHTSLSENGLH
jgi:hypothetical protein